MRALSFAWTIVPLLFFSGGCATANKSLYPPLPGTPPRTVYIVSNGWHAGLIVHRADIRPEAWPESQEIPDTEYLEVGWGSEEFYMAKSITPAIVARVVCWPTSSVLHVAGFSGQVEEMFPEDLVKVELSERGFDELCRFVHESYTRDAAGRPVRLGPGLYGVSEFYCANGSYYFPKTCNVWTARALRSAGCPISYPYAVTADNVVYQTSSFGTVVRSR